MRPNRTPAGPLGRSKFAARLVAGILLGGFVAGASKAALIVPPLPQDNLVRNPWFRNSQNTGPGTNEWVSDGYWQASDKDGNPTPDTVLGTAARISTGRGTNDVGQTVPPGVDTYLSQVVAVDPNLRLLKFDMYWVTHTLNPGEVDIYGGSSTNGPWTHIWKPFYQVYTTVIVPPGGHGQDLWSYYSDTTDLVTTLLTDGYPYYKLEVHAILPDDRGGFKITGIYFAAEPDPPNVLKIDSVTNLGAGVQMSFVAVAGKTYSVQYADVLSSSNWLTLTNLAIQAETRPIQITDPSVWSAGQRFYRVVTPGAGQANQ